MAKQRGKKNPQPKQRPRRQPQQPGWHAFWDNLSGTTQHLICAGLLLVIAVSFYAPIHFEGRAIVGSDQVVGKAMTKAQEDYRAETGELPLWNPNTFGGMPAYTIGYETDVWQVDDLVRVLRRFFWPTSHVLILMLGLYALMVFLTENKLAAMLAAVAFAFTTYLPLLLIAGHATKFITLAYAPWLLLAFAYALRKPTLLAGLLFAAALAVNLRAHHIQITYYLAFVMGIWWLAEGIRALRSGEAKRFGVTTGWLALGSVFAILMVAQPYLVLREYNGFSIRGAASAAAPAGAAAGLDWTYAMNWSHTLGELSTLLIADAYGGTGATYWGTKIFTAGPHYVGGVVILLGLLALWRVRRVSVWAFGGTAVLMMAFALGKYFPLLNRLMFEHFPLFRMFRVPETWLSVVALLLAMLAAFGCYYLARKEPDAEAEAAKSKAAYIVSGGLAAGVLLLMLAPGVFFDFEKEGEYEQVAQFIAAQNSVSPSDPRVAQIVENYLSTQRSERVDLFTRDARRTLFFVILAGLLILAYRRGMLPAWVLQMGLVLLVLVDLWGVDRRYFNDRVLVNDSDPTAQIETTDYDQFLIGTRTEAGGKGHFRVLSLDRDAMTDPKPSFHHESIGGNNAAKLRLYQDYIEHILLAGRRINDNALDMMNVAYIISPNPVGNYPPAYIGNNMNVLRNTDAVDRGYFVGQTEVIAEAEATWARLRDEAFDPRTTAILPAPLDGFETTPIDSASTATAQLVSYGPHEIVWQVDTDAPRLFVASEVYYPAGWTASLGEEDVPIHRVNYLLRGVAVPAGQHTLTMRFAPKTEALSIWISGVSTLLVYGGILLLLGLAWQRRRKG